MVARMVNTVTAPMISGTRLAPRLGTAATHTVLVLSMAAVHIYVSQNPPLFPLLMQSRSRQYFPWDVLFASEGLHAPVAKTPWMVGQKMSFGQIHLRSNPQPAAATARYAGYYNMFSNDNTAEGIGEHVNLQCIAVPLPAAEWLQRY